MTTFHVYVDFVTKKFRGISFSKDKQFRETSVVHTIQVDQRLLKKKICFVLSLLCEHKAELTIRFCDTEEMLIANKQFRHKNYPTDVLSFVGEDSAEYLGDILICLPVCQWESKRCRIPLERILEQRIVHGMVHLKGFDHERNEYAWQVMHSLERSIRSATQQRFPDSSWCLSTTK